MKQIVAKVAKGELILVEIAGPRRARLSLRDLPLRVLELTHDEFASYERNFGKQVIADVEVDTSARGIVKASVNVGNRGGHYCAMKDDAGRWTFLQTSPMPRY